MTMTTEEAIETIEYNDVPGMLSDDNVEALDVIIEAARKAAEPTQAPPGPSVSEFRLNWEKGRAWRMMRDSVRMSCRIPESTSDGRACTAQSYAQVAQECLDTYYDLLVPASALPVLGPDEAADTAPASAGTASTEAAHDDDGPNLCDKCLALMPKTWRVTCSNCQKRLCPGCTCMIPKTLDQPPGEIAPLCWDCHDGAAPAEQPAPEPTEERATHECSKTDKCVLCHRKICRSCWHIVHSKTSLTASSVICSTCHDGAAKGE